MGLRKLINRAKIMLNTENVCLGLSADSESELSKLSPPEEKMAVWNAENRAISAAKDFKYSFDPIGEAGQWYTPTVHHDVTWYWRYVGDKEDRPVFSVSHIICIPKRIAKTEDAIDEQVEVKLGFFQHVISYFDSHR